MLRSKLVEPLFIEVSGLFYAQSIKLKSKNVKLKC